MVIKAFLELGSCSTLMNPIKLHLLAETTFAKYLGTMMYHMTDCLFNQKTYKMNTSLFGCSRFTNSSGCCDDDDDELQDILMEL